MTGAKRSQESSASAPTFRELSRAECNELLTRNHIGRVAFTFHDRVDLEPVHYVYAGGSLHGRTAPGAKLAVLRHHPWIAFEVDEVEGLFDWQSVVVHGVFYIPDPDGAQAERDAYADTLAQVRSIVPAALESADPSPERNVLFRIHIDAVTGRGATSAAARAKPARRRKR